MYPVRGIKKWREFPLCKDSVISFWGKFRYIVYRDILLETALDFELYLAITQGTYKSYFQRQLTQMIIKRNQVKLLIVDAESEVIVQWID